jgi:deoxyribodipyrimidine photo-lyase
LPELDRVPAAKIHEPWKLLPVEQERFGVNIGVDYPQPVVDLFQSARTNELIYNMAFNEPSNYGDRPVPKKRCK